MKKFQIRAITYIFCVFFLSSCASWKSKSTSVDEEDDEEVAEATVIPPVEVQKGLEEIQSEYGKVDIVVNQSVMKWINYYQGRGRVYMGRYLERSTRYIDLMREVLHEEGLPEDLVYLPIIESGYSSSANSFASAVGYWQFIKPTGLRYGLNINPYIDERRDPVESTKAAARFLKALYNLFGDWYLALASYNTGENRVKSAVMKYGTRDFWVLAKKKKLLRETRDYVPKYLAALIIAKNPKQYGFTELDYKENFTFDSIPVFKSISLELLAQNMKIDYEEMKGLNPKFRSDFVPVEDGGTTYIRVPKGQAQMAVSMLEASYSDSPKIVPKDFDWYKVRRGDTLSTVAHRNHTTVATLRRLNDFERRSFIRVGQKIKIPDALMSPKSVAKTESTSVRDSASESSDSSSAGTVADVDYHTVRRGENLSLIAGQYGMSIGTIMKMNNLSRRSVIRAGQKLKVKNSDKRNSTTTGLRPLYHIVKPGENLTQIAESYDLSLQKIRDWNKIERESVIKTGQKIWLGKRKSVELVHVVRRGENLTAIANHYKTTIAAIAKQNDLKSLSAINTGRRLVIP